ncbi:MAG: hypothetical protein AABZ19_03835 [Pseudomonadota bacterium]
MSDDTLLGTPITDEAIAAVHFFNGRLLTSRDLSREQDARRTADARVGAATGGGIAWGLEVNASGTGAGTSTGNVRVDPGLALGLAGNSLKLARPFTVTLVQPPSTTTASSDGSFTPCKPLGPGTYVAGDGLFLLTLAPIDQPHDLAPVLAIDNSRTRCNTDVMLEAVQLRLLRVNDFNATGTDARAVARLRNEVAYDCFGAKPRQSAHGQPLTSAVRMASQQVMPLGLIDRMRVDGSLSLCEVPLALIYMVGDAVVFIDGQSVRRRVAAAGATVPWAPWLGERLQATTEAQFAQFQEQVADTPAVLAEAATQSLSWLPPAGFLPAATDWRRFLGARAPAREVPLSAGDAPEVLASALACDPVQLAQTSDDTRFRIYRIGGTAAGPLLFVRDSRRIRHAEQIWLDGLRADLPGVSDVQSAIDTLRNGTCLHTVLRPGMDFARVERALADQSVVSVCFEPGLYELDQPLSFTRIDRLSIQGHGALLRCAGSEQVLVVVGGGSVDIDGLALEGGKVTVGGTANTAHGLGGALTVRDTRVVRIRGVSASTHDGGALGACGIHVRLNEPADTQTPERWLRVHISDCEVRVGARQSGILCLNADEAHLHDNHIRALDAQRPMQRGITVAGQRAGDIQVTRNQVWDAIEGITVATSDTSGKDSPALQTERLELAHNRVRVQLAGIERHESRYGLFVGNVASARVQRNEVHGDPEQAAELPLHGIRIAGVFGPQVLVRDNRLQGTAIGIRFQPSSYAHEQTLWVMEANVGEGLLGQEPRGNLIVIDEKWFKRVILRDNVELP